MSESKIIASILKTIPSEELDVSEDLKKDEKSSASIQEILNEEKN